MKVKPNSVVFVVKNKGDNFEPGQELEKSYDQMKKMKEIPSMRLIDLAESIAEGCKVETIGIRPGEKLHEVLISRDEARSTVEFDDMFIVQPEFPWWGDIDRSNGKSLQDGFEYSSDNNSHWLSSEEIQNLIAEVQTDI